MSVAKYILSRDFHVHTNLSVCARKEMTVANIVRRAGRLGYRELGISDHLGGYTTPADLKKTRAKIAGLKTDVEVYLGCEMCVGPEGAPLFGPGEVAFLDYVMVGVDHVIGDVPDPAEKPKAWLSGWVRRLERIIESCDGIDIIAHPLRTLRRHYRGKPLMAHLPARRWEELTAGLAARKIAVELNDTIENHETCFDEIREFYTIAHEAGIKFSASSDAHGLDRLGFQVNWVRLAEELKLTRRDFWQCKARSGQGRTRPAEGT